MKLVITDKKINLPEKVHQYAEKKIGKLDRYFKTEAEAYVTFSEERENNNVELTVTAGNLILRANEKTSDMFASIDAAVSSVERQMRKNKTRLEKRLRQGAFERSMDTAVSSFAAEESEPEIYDVVRTKRFSLKPMTVDEAILQMNLIGHSFFAFRNMEKDGAFAVVYTRNNGGYGLIEDET
jgi:putative sigma-54 modulation protein